MAAATSSTCYRLIIWASRVPFEMLRRWVSGSVRPGCKPGPATVLTEEEEEWLASYLIQMSEIIRWSRVMHLAYNRAQRKHPFKDEKAGHTWFDGFHWRHPRYTIRSPQPLSYCRALCANTDTVNDFLGKLGAIYGRLNLIAKPTQVNNCDKMGVSIVHKPGKGKVVCEVQRRNV